MSTFTIAFQGNRVGPEHNLGPLRLEASSPRHLEEVVRDRIACPLLPPPCAVHVVDYGDRTVGYVFSGLHCAASFQVVQED